MATFPTIEGGIRVQLPWSYRRDFLTTRNDMEAGNRYVYSERATPLRSWTMQFPAITAAEAVTLSDFFAARKGRWEVFDLVDPETLVTVPNCRFGQDECEVRHVGKNLRALTLLIEETRV